MINLIERVYNIRVTQAIKKAPRWRRAKKAVSLVKEFLKRHMKTEEVKLGKELNEYIWKNGGKNPPTYYKIKVVKKDNIAYANLIDAKIETKEREETKQEIKEEVKSKENKNDNKN
jgi:large subunit ribosomal protein L31e